MWVPLIRLVSLRNLAKHDLIIRFNSVSSLAQLPFSDVSDSSSDENPPFSHNNNSTNSFGHTRHVFDRYRFTKTLEYLLTKPKTAMFLITHLKESDFKHDVVTYISIIRFLCYWGMMERLQYVFLEVIEDKIGAFGFEISDLVEELLEEMNVDGWNLFNRAIDALVTVFCKVWKFDEAFDVLLKVQSGFLPSVFTCNLFMKLLVEEGKVDMAMVVYDHLKKNGFCPTAYTYGIVVKGLCKKSCLKEAGEVFKEMNEAGVEPNSFTSGSYIDGLCSNGYTNLALDVLKMSDSPIDVFAYTSVVRGFVKELKLEEAENIFLEMKKVAIVPNVYCYGALIQGYCRKLDILKAVDLHNEMCSKGIRTNCVIVSSIMQCWCHLGMSFKAVNEFINAMESGIFLDEISFNIAIDALCTLGQMEKAMVLLEDMKRKKMKLDVKHYTTLIKGYCLQSDLINAFNIFNEMKQKGLKPDTITFNMLLDGLSKCGLFEETMCLFDTMKMLGLEPTKATNNVIIEGLCKSGKVKEAGLFFNNLERKSLNDYVAMVNAYCDTNNVIKAYELFLTLSNQEKEGFLRTKASCCLKLLSCLCEKGETDRALILFKEILKSENGASKFMYSKLMYAYCRAGDMKMARCVFDDMISRGIIPDVISYTIMLDGYCRMNCLKEAKHLLNDMINHGIQPDNITYTVLFQRGFLEWEKRNGFD
ncbi:hypothetical protein L2E82_41870 [Cichorium intybus]|uniref:Uncharacterized protein n=1 Tax=Cichorium intybus TaxID=13427 RepID=A0ACB8ZL57_CICIN|nr:hypothetical protein L2E82_41870 [Cichorium intybus]